MMDGERRSVPSAVSLLKKHRLRPKKQLGQNFLVDGRVLARIIEAADLHGREAVLEIGPGLGVLTRALAGEAWRVLAVEKDRGLAPVLEEVLQGAENVRVLWSDVLELDLPEVCRGYFGERTVRVVANLPYYATTPILMKLLEDGPPLDLIVVMVQKEVAERLTAGPGTKEYGALTVAVQWHTERVEWVARVPASSFFPRPAVDSAVVRLHIRPDAAATEEAAWLSRVVRAGFAQRRKTLLNALSHAFAGDSDRRTVEAALREAGIDPERRAEALALEDFVRLAQALAVRIHPK
ncbi:MAG: 16S rRNA (adenine(1518)-N(6)/adenine(1519)-N(6))-dimethyltransferase RsmA [Alicyclobacillaceae bacterium]|nr:16S rRNA (adenine(1518)-N(6)/adenine(1519)-N(6))-dimethyltransferase RsmA [Alicyclobacillaceae bacterium]